MKRTILLICCLTALMQVANAHKGQTEIDTLTHRLLTVQLAREVDKPLLEKSLATIRPDGSWADIDYDAVVLGFPAGKHLDRLVNMSLAYAKEGTGYTASEELRDKILAALDCFYKKRPTSTNWWYIDIGAPQEYMVALLLMKGKIDRQTLLHYSSYLEDRTGNQAHQGKNRTWVSNITICKGCIEDNCALIEKGFASIASTICISGIDGEEGIKIDYSLHQHRPQLYSGGYGMGFMADLAETIYLVRGLSFSGLFTPAKIQILSDVMLQGQMLFGYRQGYDFGTVGRNISRPNSLNNVSPHTLDLMAVIDPAHADRYKAWEAHIQGAPYPEPGNKYFWKSDIMTHHGANYYLSAKVISTRTNGTEMLNGENLKGYYLPLGATNILVRGDEYKDIFPVWDWTRVPGTTSVANPSTADLRWYLFGSNRFAGGAGNSRNGLIAFENAYNGVQAKKAYFFFGDAMVCLGAGIEAVKTQDVRTSVNQCLLNGEIQTGANWVYHDRVGYLFPEHDSITVRHSLQKGSWSLLSNDSSNDTIAKDVFNLWINHGKAPIGGTYYYIVMPDRSLAGFKKEVTAYGFTLIKNTPQVQAIRNGMMHNYGAVFYEPGEIELDNGLHLSVDKSAVIYLEKTPEGYELTVSDPLHSQQSVHVGLNATTVEVKFPQGDLKGKGVTVALSLNQHTISCK